MTLSEWKEILPSNVYHITREDGTEPPNSSPLKEIKSSETGTFLCSNCYQPLFTPAQKYDSGYGWPSFSNHLPNALFYNANGTVGTVGYVQVLSLIHI